MAQLKILDKTRDELRVIKSILKAETAESMAQIIARLTHAEFTRITERDATASAKLPHVTSMLDIL